MQELANDTSNILLDSDFANEIEINSADIDIFSFFTELGNYYNESQLKQYIEYPMLYHNELSKIAKLMYSKNGIFAQTISKMTAAPSLDYVVMPYSTIKESEDLINKINHIMKHRLNHKLSTRDCIYNALLTGEYVAILRDTKARNDIPQAPQFVDSDKIEGLAFKDNMMLQPLDLNYVRFEGFMNGDYVVSFDMQYFDQFKNSGLVGEIKNYPENFIRGYNEYKKDGLKRWLILDQKTTFAFKFRGAISESHGRSLGLFAMLDILFSDDYTDSQRSNMRENSSTIRYMTLPEGEKKGSCSLNKEQQKNQYDNFKKAVYSNDNNNSKKLAKTTTLKLAPGTQIGKLDNSNTFLKDTLTEENNKAISTDLGLAQSALNGEGQGASYSSLSVNIDLMLAEVFQMLEQIQWQYTKIINNYLGIPIEKWIEIVYLKTSTLNQETSFTTAKDLYMLAGGSRTWLYAVGTGDANTYLRLMKMEKELDYDNEFPVHATSYTFSDSADKENPDNNLGGRPSKNMKELSDKGIETKSNGGNKMKKLSTKK
jgi:hypothetical protein